MGRNEIVMSDLIAPSRMLNSAPNGQGTHQRALMTKAKLGAIMRTAILACMIGFATISIARAKTCSGEPAPQLHTPSGGFEFQTDSQADTGRNDIRTFWTCVENLDDTDLHVVWYVPQFSQWVPPGKLRKQPRFRKVLPAKPINGCLKYGNVGKTVVAQFLGTQAEEALAWKQVKNQCAGLGGRTTPAPPPEMRTADDVQKRQGGALRPITFEFEINFPSDFEHPHDTMLDLKGTVFLKLISGKEYQLGVNYVVSKFDGRPKGDPSIVRVQPGFTGPAEQLFQFFNASHKQGYLELGPSLDDRNSMAEGSFSFEVSGSKNWELHSTAFQFVDKKENVLASLAVPVFLPATK